MYYVNDASTFGDSFTSAVGNDANNGLTPATPKLTLAAVGAIDAAGDTVFVDSGTYAENLTLDASGLMYIGHTTNPPRVGLAAANPAITISSNNCNLRSFLVRGVALGISTTGNFDNIENNQVETTTGRGIVINLGADTASVSGNRIYNAGSDPILANGANGFFYNNVLDSYSKASGFAFNAVGRNTRIDSNTVQDGFSGIQVWDSFCTVTNNYFTRVKSNIVSFAFTTSESCVFTGNSIYDGRGIGFALKGRWHTVSNNTVDSMVNNCIEVTSATGKNWIDSNIIRNGKFYGIKVSGKFQDITRNTIQNILLDAIQLSFADSCVISGNRISSDGTNQTNNSTGIDLLNAADTNVIEQNRIDSVPFGIIVGTRFNIIRGNGLTGVGTNLLRFIANENVVSGNTFSGNPTTIVEIPPGATVKFCTTTHNNILPATFAASHGAANSTFSGWKFDFTRNYWGTIDSAVIRSIMGGFVTANIRYVPFRLGMIDTTLGADSVAPHAPATVTSTSLADTSKRIDWSPVTIDEDGGSLTGLSGYKVYRTTRIDSSSYILLGTVDSTITSFTDSGLAVGETRVYRVTAFDTAISYVNESFYSDSAATTQIVGVDTAGPTGSILTATDTSLRNPTIRWTAAVDSSGVALYRLRVLSLLDSSTSLIYDTTALSVQIDSALIFGSYLAELICTDVLGNVNLSVDSRTFSIIPETSTLTSPANFSCTGTRTITLTVVKNAGTDILLIYKNGVLIDTVSSTETTVTRDFNLDTTTGRDTTFINFRAQLTRSGVVLQSIYSDTFTLCFDTTYATSATSVTVSETAAFYLSPATYSSESAQILVRDANGGGVIGSAVNYSVVAKPTGATGEAIVSTVTDSFGISRVNLLAGDKAGVYVVKAVVAGLTPAYVAFHTYEYDLPAATWRLIGLNRAPTDATTSKALTGLNPTDIFHWNPSIAEHANNLRYEKPASLVVGDGYYIWSAAAVRFSVSGTILATDTRDIAIKSGWNQIGVPYPYLTRWNSAQIVSGGTTMTLSAAEAAGIIQNKIFWYRENAYQFGPSTTNVDPILAPWSGIWLKAYAAATLRLSPYFYYAESIAAPLASAQRVRAAGLGATDNWTARLTISGSSGSEVTNFFGVAPTATNGNDRILDVENPPIVSGQFATGLGVGGVFAQELKAPFTAAQRWDFSVTPTTGDNSVILTFGDLANLPSGFIALLVDLSNGAQTFLTTTPSYRFSTSGLATARSFRIFAGAEAAVRALALPALTTSQTFVRPNPGPGPDGLVRFSYNATVGGALKLIVFDIGGRKVIERTIDLNSFPTEYPWNCRNDLNQSISTGIYIYVLQYSANGEERRITDKLAIFR